MEFVRLQCVSTHCMTIQTYQQSVLRMYVCNVAEYPEVQANEFATQRDSIASYLESFDIVEIEEGIVK